MLRLIYAHLSKKYHGIFLSSNREVHDIGSLKFSESLIDLQLVKLSIHDAGRDVENIHCTMTVLKVLAQF